MPLEAISFFAVSAELKSKSGKRRIDAQDVRGQLVGVANEMMRRVASAKSQML